MFLFCLQIAILSLIFIVTIHHICLEFPKLYPQKPASVQSLRHNEICDVIAQEKEKKAQNMGCNQLAKDENSEESKEILKEHLRKVYNSQDSISV